MVATDLEAQMPTHIVDLSARSELFRNQRLVSHAWLATPADVAAFLRSPRSELKKLGIRLPAECRVETVIQNHDWLTGHTDGLQGAGRITVFCRGEGDGATFYRVSLFASKATEAPVPRTLLHEPDEQERPARPISKVERVRVDASRRSMLASPLHTDVHRWLSPLTIDRPYTKSADEAHRIFVAICGLVEGMLQHHPELRAARDDVAALLQRPSHPSFGLLLRATRDQGVTLHGAFTEVMYAKALSILRTSHFHHDSMIDDVRRIMSDVPKALGMLTATLSRVDPDFIPHLAVEATYRRQGDRVLDARLAEAADLFARHAPQEPERSPRLTARATGLAHFAPDHAGAWWFIPGLVAFAMSVWPEP